MTQTQAHARARHLGGSLKTKAHFGNKPNANTEPPDGPLQSDRQHASGPEPTRARIHSDLQLNCLPSDSESSSIQCLEISTTATT